MGQLSHLDDCSRLLECEAGSSALPHLRSTAGLPEGAWPEESQPASGSLAGGTGGSSVLPRRGAPLLHRAPRLTLGFLH